MIKSKKLFDTLIYFIRSERSVLRVGQGEFPDAILDILIKKDGIVIWENQGIFKLISAPILHNIWLTREASQQLKKGYTRIEGPGNLEEISWGQGILISPTIVKNILLVPCEKRNGFSNSDPTAQPAKEHTNADIR